MSSGVLAGQQEQLGSGGKIVRGRRLVPSFSPYSRPSSSTAPLPLPIQESQSERRPSWIFGVISGAGKLISSVLGSDGGGSSLSESSSDYESDENYDSIPDEHEDRLFSDNLTGYGMRVDGNVDSLAIVPKSEIKLVIQELLMQETFTRDECNKMMEIIQSRVIDIPYSDIGKGRKNKALEGASTKGPSLYLDHNKNFTRASSISTFSTRHYSHGATSPNLHNKAVIEAKKWFEEKKLSPMAIHDQESEPVSLNTKHDFGSDGSPIEVAKSYMQALPPWRSPSFSNVSFKTRAPIGNSFYEMGSNLLPTSKDSEKHRTFLKPVVDEPQGSQVGCSESPTRVSVLEASRHQPETEQNGNKVEEGNYKLHNGNVANVVHQMATDDHLSECDILQPKEKLKESVERVKVPVQPKEQRCASSGSQNSGALASVAGDSFLETEISQPENLAPAETSTQQNSGDKMILGTNNFSHVNADPGVEHSHSKIDLEPSDGNPCMLKDTNKSEKCFESNGHVKEIKVNSVAVSTSKGDATTTNSSNEGAAEASISSEVPSTRGNASDPNNGANMNSSEPVLREPAGPSKGKRRVKKVVRQKKWRG